MCFYIIGSILELAECELFCDDMITLTIYFSFVSEFFDLNIHLFYVFSFLNDMYS